MPTPGYRSMLTSRRWRHALGNGKTDVKAKSVLAYRLRSTGQTRHRMRTPVETYWAEAAFHPCQAKAKRSGSQHIVMTTVKVGRRGQITIPKEIRQALHIEEGDRVAFVKKGEDVVLRPLKSTLRDHRGSVPVDGPQDFDAIRNQVLREHAAKTARDAT